STDRKSSQNWCLSVSRKTSVVWPLNTASLRADFIRLVSSRIDERRRLLSLTDFRLGNATTNITDTMITTTMISINVKPRRRDTFGIPPPLCPHLDFMPFTAPDQSRISEATC